MLPINDSQPNRYSLFPVMTILIIVVNTLVFILEMNLNSRALYAVFLTYGTIPADIWNREGAGIISVMTSMFLHGDIFHLGSNMLFLWVFGRRVEDACGMGRYLLYYLLTGCLADVLTFLIQPNEHIPSIGASGAIFGIIGAYLILYPGGRIRVFIPIYLIVGFWPRLRAFWIVLYYIVIQLPPAIITLATGANFGVGHWAHIGGFLGCIFIPFFLRPDAFARFISAEHSISAT
jgi:membrane associated rhomboid family serine protease